MKKRLEAELMSIAHRVLKLKGKEDIEQLCSETQKLYEVLSVLKFVENNINIIQPKMDVDDIEQKLDFEFYNTPEDIAHKIEAGNEYISKLEDEIEELRVDLDKIEKKIENTVSSKTVFFEDLILDDFKEPIFEKIADKTKTDNKETVTHSIDKSTIGINISLNDRVGFVKHLFDDNNEDYIRVLSQLSTIDTLNEAKDFIDNMVKPDYNNWQGKEDFETRFIEIIEQKFKN
jgi:tetrahydromethanopterin S-methyltransferase subunit G